MDDISGRDISDNGCKFDNIIFHAKLLLMEGQPKSEYGFIIIYWKNLTKPNYCLENINIR